MVSSEILEIIKTDPRQTDLWAKFIESKGYKTILLKNNSILHEFKLGNISVLKSFRPNLNEEILEEIQQIANSKTNLLCKISPNYDFDENLKDKFKYQEINATMSATKTCIIDLTKNLDDIYKDYSENTRYKINRSIREKDRIEIIQNPKNKDIDKFYDSLEERQKFKKFISYTREEVRYLSNLFWNDSFIVSAYDKNNKIVVSNIYFLNKGKVTYFAGSLNTENHKSKAGYQLIHEATKFFKNYGVKVYDFEGITDERNRYTFDWVGVTNFKLKFGKTVLTYPSTLIKYNNPIFKGLTKIFRID